MWIRRLAVENWRGLSWTLEGLAPGLNLIAGPNEAGKSRLVQALRFALFESTKGRSEHKRALATWGVDPGRPRVAVDFQLAGVDWHLEKVFLGTGCNTQLRGGGRTLNGEAAESQLAELLGAEPARTTELKPEDRGIWSLLWVDQGASRELPVHSESSQSRLLDQLSREVGEVAAGAAGQQLLARVEAHYGQFYSIANGRPLKTLTDPEALVAELSGRLAAAIGRRDALARSAEDLAAARTREADQAARVASAEARLVDISMRYEAAQSLAHRLEVAAGQVRVAEQARDQAAAAAQRARVLDTEAERLRAEVDEGAARVEAARTACDQRQAAATIAGTGSADLEARIAASDRAIAALRGAERRNRLRMELARLRTRQADAGILDAGITRQRQALAALPPITQRDAAALRNAEDARNTARARLDGASASLALTAFQPLRIDGETVPAGASRTLLVQEDRVVTVEGVLAIAVSPGGGEILKLREALHDAERLLAAELARLGVDDLIAAERIARQRHEIGVEIERGTAELARLVPEGLDELARAVAELESALAPGADEAPETTSESANRAVQPDAAATTPNDDEFDPASLDAAERELRALNQALQQARGERDAAIEQFARARELLAAQGQQHEADRRRLADLTSQRAELPDHAALTTALAVAEQAFGERVAARDALQRQFDASGGASLEQDLERARRAAEQLREMHRRTVAELNQLTGLLRGASNEALHETVQDLEAELGEAQARLARVQRDAGTAQRLYTVLTREHQSARERLTGPVVERIKPYLADLFPGSQVWLDEELGLRGLRSPAADEAFEALSGGAREQLSLLVRLGLAEVLGTGESWPLVLDDVLVNTDATRIRRMQRALFNAGRHMQILLFTCHGELFDGLGPEAWIELPPPRR
jgi:DNA repair exonuclease SbcCD ATPase subunit